jgi:hypothetical protein
MLVLLISGNPLRCSQYLAFAAASDLDELPCFTFGDIVRFPLWTQINTSINMEVNCQFPTKTIAG